MKRLFILLFFTCISYPMDQVVGLADQNDKHIQWCKEKALKNPAFIKELHAPVLTINNVHYYFTVDKCSDSETLSDKKILEEREKEHEQKREQKKSSMMRKRENLYRFYRNVSVLCIVLGHLSGIW